MQYPGNFCPESIQIQEVSMVLRPQKKSVKLQALLRKMQVGRIKKTIPT